MVPAVSHYPTVGEYGEQVRVLSAQYCDCHTTTDIRRFRRISYRRESVWGSVSSDEVVRAEAQLELLP